MVERITGERWSDRMQHRILGPLGLNRTTYAAHAPAARGWLVHPWQDTRREEPTYDAGAMAPAGQLWSTADDLFRWGRVLAEGADGVLAPDTAVEMRAPVAMVDTESWTLASGLGLALTRSGDCVYCGHSGSMPGFVSSLAVHPATGWSAVSFANCYTGVAVTSLAHKALRAVLDAVPELPTPWTPRDEPPADIAPLTGRWWWMGEEVTASYDMAAQRLILDSAYDDEGDMSSYERTDRDLWRCVEGLDVGEDLRVERDDSGDVVALETRTFVFVRDPWPANPR
jgi:CubicO group peptidase (beta-lactamase class C family)